MHKKLFQTSRAFMHVKFDWRDVRVAEGARLESVCIRNGTVGSNPTLSAKLLFPIIKNIFIFLEVDHFCFAQFEKEDVKKQYHLSF